MTDTIDEVDEGQVDAQERQMVAEEAHELDQAIRKGIAQGRETLWEVAKNLYEFEEIQGWVAIGLESKNEWLADPEINMTAPTFYRLTSVWREFAIRREVELSTLINLDVSKAHIVLPKLQMGKVRLKTALNDIEALGSRDLRDKYIGERKPVGPSLEDDESDPEALEGDETAEESTEEPEAVSEAENGAGDRKTIDKEKRSIIKQAEKDWEALRSELLTVAESGQAHPRVDVKLILPGIQGANLLIEQWRLSNGRRGKAA